VPEEDRGYLTNQLDTLNKLQESVIRNAVNKQEDLIRKILQQQDFDTQLQSCLHVVNEVEASICNEFCVEADTRAMKEKLALCEVCIFLLQITTHFFLTCENLGCTVQTNRKSPQLTKTFEYHQSCFMSMQVAASWCSNKAQVQYRAFYSSLRHLESKRG
jgi:hypothetical protein